MFLIYFLNKQSIDQQMVQRFLSGKIYVKKIILYIFSIYKFIYKAKSKRTAQLSLILNAPLLTLIISLCCLVGLILYAIYFKCDPLTSKISNPNQLVTFYVISNLYDIPGFGGLFLGSLFCGNLI